MPMIPSSTRPAQTESGLRMRAATTEPRWVRVALMGSAFTFLALFLIVPLAAVFVNALSKGFAVFFGAISDPDALSAVRLTLLTAAIAVPLNVTFGLAAAWAIAKFEF